MKYAFELYSSPQNIKGSVNEEVPPILGASKWIYFKTVQLQNYWKIDFFFSFQTSHYNIFDMLYIETVKYPMNPL